MLGLMQYPQRVLLHKQQKGPRTFLATLKYVAAQQPTDGQFRYSKIVQSDVLRNSVDTTAAITNRSLVIILSCVTRESWVST